MFEPTKQPEVNDRSLSESIRTGDVDIVRARLTAGEKPTEDDIDDIQSALCAASERGRVDLAQLLIDHDARVSGSGALPAAAAGQEKISRWCVF